MYTRSPCTEFQDATCGGTCVIPLTLWVTVSAVPLIVWCARAGCSPCGPAQYEVQDCGGSADRVCGACDPACASCHGNDSYSCAACSAGYQFVDMGAYGGQTGVQRCVPREACTYSAWSPWSNCSTMCGGGTADRTRNLTSQWPCYDSQAADGTQPCNTQQCGTGAGMCASSWRCMRCCFAPLSFTEEPTLTFHLLITNMTAAGINSTQRHAITALFVITLSLEPFVVSLLSVEYVAFLSQGCRHVSNCHVVFVAGTHPPIKRCSGVRPLMCSSW